MWPRSKSGPALHTASESGTAFAGPAGPSMPPLSLSYNQLINILTHPISHLNAIALGQMHNTPQGCFLGAGLICHSSILATKCIAVDFALLPAECVRIVSPWG